MLILASVRPFRVDREKGKAEVGAASRRFVIEDDSRRGTDFEKSRFFEKFLEKRREKGKNGEKTSARNAKTPRRDGKRTDAAFRGSGARTTVKERLKRSNVAG